MLARGRSGFRLGWMRTEGSGPALEARRRLAVGLVLAGEETADVAELLGVHAASVRRWVRAFGLGGDWALSPAPVPGRQTPYRRPPASGAKCRPHRLLSG